MVYMLAYIPLIFPSTWLLDKKGLRVVIICGSFLNAVGAWIKVACVNPDRFALLMFGQSVCSVAQIFILGIPARLAAIWFGPNQVSTATSLGVFGNQIGAAVGFLLPPLLVKYSPDIDLVSSRLYTLFYIGAGVTTVLFLLVLVIFKKEPPQPPSRAQWLAVRNATSQHYGKSLLRLLKNRRFLLLGHQKEAGEIGLTVVIAGIGGDILAGVWLDKTKTFKFFMTGYLPVGFEIAAEITYPESEGTSSGLLNASAQVTKVKNPWLWFQGQGGDYKMLLILWIKWTSLILDVPNINIDPLADVSMVVDDFINSTIIMMKFQSSYLKTIHKYGKQSIPTVPKDIFADIFKAFTKMCCLLPVPGSACRSIMNIHRVDVSSTSDVVIMTKAHLHSQIAETASVVSIAERDTGEFLEAHSHIPRQWTYGEQPTTRTHRNTSSDSSELKEADDREPLVHENPAILKRVGQKVLGQHGVDLLLHQSLYCKTLDEERSMRYIPGMIVIGTEVDHLYFTGAA
ncbi:FLVCR [Mytilus coruscus]|uniref:FLVCR n=1 Tax=Mytilus coruscus TaxID=42192 RepID=A0A6J8C884_MYTCO|nr:FLVCR [Mytilus coruscus]